MSEKTTTITLFCEQGHVIHHCLCLMLTSKQKMNIIRLISKLTSASFREKANSSSSFLHFNLFQNSEIYNFNFKYTLLSSCRCAGSTLKRNTIFTVGVFIATGDQNENFDGYSSEA